jgi:hypothetical protein
VFGGKLRLASVAGLVGLAGGFYAGEQVYPPDGALVVGGVVGLVVFVVAFLALA